MKWDSSSMGVPKRLAVESLDPADSPAIRKSVFLVTEEVVLPPSSLTRDSASRRVMEDRVPVITNVRRSHSLVCLLSDRLSAGTSCSNLTPASDNKRMTAMLAGTPK